MSTIRVDEKGLCLCCGGVPASSHMGPYEKDPLARIRWLQRQHNFDQVLEAASRSERDLLIHHIVEAAIARGLCDAKVQLTMNKVVELCVALGQPQFAQECAQEPKP